MERTKYPDCEVIFGALSGGCRRETRLRRLLAEIASSLAGSAQAIVDAGIVSAGNLALLSQLLTVEVPVVNLKQFRDATQPTRACYQAIIGSSCKVEKLHGVSVLGNGHLLDVHPCANHQIREDLGLSSTGEIPLPIGVLIDMDFSVGVGEEIHRNG